MSTLLQLPSVIIDAQSDGAVLQGAAIATMTVPCELILVGDEASVRQSLAHIPHNAERIRIVHAPDQIPEYACPREALSAYPMSSIAVATQQLASTDAIALVTAGHAGAAVLAAEQMLDRIPGVRRGALAAVFPTLRLRGKRKDPFALLVDVGANLSPNDKDYLTNATMGAAYASLVSANKKPTVALLSNTTTPAALSTVQRAAHQLLSSALSPNWTYYGLIRADQLTQGEADVILTDGHTGDIVIRTMEGLAASGEAMLAQAKQRFRWRVGVSMLGGGLQRLRELSNWENYGGAPLLGYTKPVMFTQTNASERAIVGAIRLALKLEREQMVAHVREAIESK